MDRTPRIQAIAVEGVTTLKVKWKGGSTECVDLIGWIAGGGDILAALREPAVFRNPRVADYGAAVAWDDDDLRIDAVHLRQLALEQRPFGAKEAIEWQQAMGISNHEAAALLGVSVSTWSAYKAGATIPNTVAMLCRAARRDPILMNAHFRPRRRVGRPRKSA